MGLLLLASASASERCISLDETELRTNVIDAQVAIDRGDIALLSEILHAIELRVPCLSFAPPPRLWADYQVAEAILAFSEGGDWQHPMAAALQIRPNVDRGVGGGHPLASWQPPTVDALPAEPVPNDVELYVDGSRVGILPPTAGRHLVQIRDDRWFTTRIYQDAEVDPNWLAAPVPRPPHVEVWMRGGVMAQGGATTQARSWSPSDYIPQGSPAGQTTSAIALGDVLVVYSNPRVGLYGSFGTSLGATLEKIATTMVTDVVWAPGRLMLGGGLGLVGIDVWEGHASEESPEAQRAFLLRYPNLLVHYRLGKRLVWDATVLAGARSDITRVQFDLGATSGKKAVRWRAGAGIASTKVNFIQEDRSNRMVTASRTVGGLQFGVVWGDY